MAFSKAVCSREAQMQITVSVASCRVEGMGGSVHLD